MRGYGLFSLSGHGRALGRVYHLLRRMNTGDVYISLKQLPQLHSCRVFNRKCEVVLLLLCSPILQLIHTALLSRLPPRSSPSCYIHTIILVVATAH